MAEWKCQNPRCRHRIERHEILASGRVMCTDCECRDYVLPLLIAKGELTADELTGPRMTDPRIHELANAVEDAIEFWDEDQWPELPS